MLHCVIAHEDRNTGISSGWLQRTKIASWLVGFVDVACDHLADKRGNNTANYENLKKIIIHGISAARPVGETGRQISYTPALECMDSGCTKI